MQNKISEFGSDYQLTAIKRRKLKLKNWIRKGEARISLITDFADTFSPSLGCNPNSKSFLVMRTLTPFSMACTHSQLFRLI